MNRSRFMLTIGVCALSIISVLVVLAAVAFTPTAEAQSPLDRTYVSPTGSDDNPCTLSEPCRTFTRALSQTATKGEVVVLASGSFPYFTIDKSVSIIAPPGVYAAVTFAGEGPAISIIGSAPIVVLRGLTISSRGIGSGDAQGIIYYASGGVLHVENCVIDGFPSHGLWFGGGQHLFVKDSIVRNGLASAEGGIGILVDNAKATIDRSRFENNGGGVIVNTNGVVTIRDSIAAGNSVGFGTNDSVSELNIENCMVTGNGFGISSVGIIRMSNTMVTGNNTGLWVYRDKGYNGVIRSFGNNKIDGNANDGLDAITVTLAQR